MENFTSNPIYKILEGFHSQSKSIGWILSYIKTFFCIIDLEGAIFLFYIIRKFLIRNR